MTTLKKGSKGAEVVTLQTKLKALGYAVGIDGIFGTGTQGCVKAYQKSKGLYADGIVGALTWSSLTMSSPKLKYHVLQYNRYTRIVKISKADLLKADVVDSITAKETVKHMFERIKPTIMFNGGLFGMKNGVSLSKFYDNGKKITAGIYTDYALVVDKFGKIHFQLIPKWATPENDVLGFSPSLIVNGVKLIDLAGLTTDYGFVKSRHPRLAFGEDATHYYIVAVHGRNLLKGYIGMTINELAALGMKLGLVNFGNFDGGGSIMVLGIDGKPLNDPLENRGVDNAVALWIK